MNGLGMLSTFDTSNLALKSIQKMCGREIKIGASHSVIVEYAGIWEVFEMNWYERF